MSNQSVLQINPTLAVSWVEDNTIRIGFDREHSRICSPSDGIRALLSSLLIGCSLSTLKRSATRYRVCEEELQELLTVLEPVLIRSNQPDSLARLNLTEDLSCKVIHTASGDSARQTTANVINQLQQLGITAKPASSGEICTLQLVLHRFMMLPDRVSNYNPEIAELPIVFGDQQVRLRPLQANGFTPCMQCVESHYQAYDGEREQLTRKLSYEAPATETAEMLRLLLPFARTLMQQFAVQSAQANTLAEISQSVNTQSTQQSAQQLYSPMPPSQHTASELVFDFYGGSLLPPRKRQIKAVPDCGCTRLRSAVMPAAAVGSSPHPRISRERCA